MRRRSLNLHEGDEDVDVDRKRCGEEGVGQTDSRMWPH